MSARRTMLIALALLVAPLPARAETWRLELGPLAGATALDPGLADYRWDTAPRLESGLETTAGRGPWRAGLRLRRTRTTQGTGLAGGPADPTVRLTDVELLARARVARPLGIGVWVSASAGWLHLGYTPDALSVDPGTGPVNVALEPVDEATFGGGLRLRRTLGRAWAVALSGEAATFALDTAHRRGDEIVQQRDRFWNWSLRLALTWRTELGS